MQFVQRFPPFFLAVLAGFCRPGAAAPETAAGTPASASASATLQQARKEKKHTVVLVYRVLDVGGETEKLQRLLTRLAKDREWRNKVRFYQLELTHVCDDDRGFVEKYRLTSAPVPRTLVFAPNGALVGCFARRTFTEKDLISALAGPVRAEVAKHLENGDAVLLFVPGRDPKQNDAVLKTARDLLERPELAGTTAVVVADAKDADAKDCFTHYSLNTRVEQATVYFLFAPGRYGGQVVGPTDADQLYAALLSAFNAGFG